MKARHPVRKPGFRVPPSRACAARFFVQAPRQESSGHLEKERASAEARSSFEEDCVYGLLTGAVSGLNSTAAAATMPAEVVPVPFMLIRT